MWLILINLLLTRLIAVKLCMYERPKEVVHVFLRAQSVAQTFGFSHVEGYIHLCYTKAKMQ